MNQLTLLVVVLVLFCYFGGKYCPSVLKKNKKILLGVAGGLVLCSFFGLRLEGFWAWSPTQDAMREYSADSHGSALFHCETDMKRGEDFAARSQLCGECRDSGCAIGKGCSEDGQCASRHCQNNLCVAKTAIHSIAQGSHSGSPPAPPPPPPSALDPAVKTARDLSIERNINEMNVGICNLPYFQDLACRMERLGDSGVWTGAGCEGEPCQ